MIDWIKDHVEALICFFLFGLLVLVSLYFLSTEEKRLNMGQLEEVRVDESVRAETFQRTLDDIASGRGRIMAVFADKPAFHYDLLIRRNPFKPMEVVPEEEVVVAPVEPVEPAGPDEPVRPVEPVDRFDLVVRGIIRFGSAFTANIENSRTGASYFRREGEEVEGYKITEIRSDKVILTKGEETRELRYGR